MVANDILILSARVRFGNETGSYSKEYSSGCADMSDDQVMVMLDHHGQNPIHMGPQVYRHEGVVGTPEKRTIEGLPMIVTEIPAHATAKVEEKGTTREPCGRKKWHSNCLEKSYPM